MDVRTAQQRAITKALAVGGAAAVRRIRFGLYKVESATRPGAVHTVCTDRGEWRCTCESALAGRPVCWHRAAVFVAKTEARGARVTGPAAGAPQAEAPGNVIRFPQRRAA
jgi:hypothetical protein